MITQKIDTKIYQASNGDYIIAEQIDNYKWVEHIFGPDDLDGAAHFANTCRNARRISEARGRRMRSQDHRDPFCHF